MSDTDDFRIPPFPALRAFHAAARHGRLKDAAAELGITESAVSHQIRRLEAYLQLPLFHRRPGGLVLTADGERYFTDIDPAFVQLASATRSIMGAMGRRRVSLTLPASLATLWLIPRLGKFEAACPDIALNLVTSSRMMDLRRERLDLAIRYGAGSWSGVEAEFLMGETAMPVCHPSLFEGETEPDPGEALQRCRLITNAIHPNEWEEWTSARGLQAPDLSDALGLELQDQVLEAAAQGLGLAMGRSPMVDDRLANGSLIAPFGMASRSPTSFYLCQAKGLELSAAARRTAAWLRDMAKP